MTNLSMLSLARNQLNGSLADAWGANNSAFRLAYLSMVRHCLARVRQTLPIFTHAGDMHPDQGRA